MLKSVASAVSLSSLISTSAMALNVEIPMLVRETEEIATLSNLDPRPADLSIQGAELAIADNTTTGKFLGHQYSLKIHNLSVAGDLADVALSILADHQIIITDLPSEDLLQIADLPEAANALIINATAEDSALRDGACRANVLHTAPSLAMRTDALMQYFLFKRWGKLAMIEGTYPQDTAYAEALRYSATKFGLKVGETKTWAFDADMRRNAAAEVPLFTQDLRDYDVLLVADEAEDFGRYVAYNTWLPRPVAGSEGISPQVWAPVVEQWGAAQLHSRFEELADRSMKPEDYGAWAAVRSIGEAVTRTNATDAPTLRDYMLSPEFALAGFKGTPQTFRAWNGQMRQPVPLVTSRAMVMQAPLPGFMHQTNELDTLGVDAPESSCTAFKE
ncbi:ABC transporter substrate-binding protein [Donghicola eburneus]|jgi:ABC transporter substrate binding protein (PQQ-dependent alcohol dehydrogenase system)|uniref:Branched-chain amino acid ABC transporter substrate-binding protein n=1 Tax=Donghicola eburneus TaxID=393278 RepID=A0A1M4MXY8_9RHOB|nr:ABC transporter substrate-binding protein [Donghicola eburneus]SCM66594.1 branched-chain amino acid ABC transporter substrate-binding protein [Donghicola eburneus]